MTTASSHFLNTARKRLFTVSLLVALTCLITNLALQPTRTSAQEFEVTPTLVTALAGQNDFLAGKEISPTTTPGAIERNEASRSGKKIQPTPTASGGSRSAMKVTLNNNGTGDGSTPITATRGYTELAVSVYDASDLSGAPIYTGDWDKSIDYELWCADEASSHYPSCQLVDEITYGNSYSVRWLGSLVVPVDGEYIFRFGKVDDGARLYLDDSTLPQIDFWSAWAPPYTVTLTAGRHNIKVEYQQRRENSAQLQVRWKGPTFRDEVIPMANQVPECDCTIHPECCENSEGGPINTRTGNYDYAQQDISIPALGEPLKFKRTYNSLKPGAPMLGNGWTYNYNLHLTRTPGGLMFESCGGQQYTYLENVTYGAFSYQGTPGVTGILTRTNDYWNPTYTLTTANNERYTFNSDGLPTEIRNAQGQVTILTYTYSLLTRVADATGERYLDFTYDEQSRLSQISDPLSRTVQYGYDEIGNLTTVTDTLGHPWTYVYTGTLLQEIRNPAGEVVEHTEFDTARRGVRQWQGNRLTLELHYLDTVDRWGLPAQTTVITHATGQVTTDSYNSRGTLMQQSDSTASTSKTFDANYNPATTTDPNGHPTSFSYNAAGRPLVITDALGSATQLEYDTQNHLMKLTDAAGSSSYYTYTGNLLTAQSNALGHTTIYTYVRHEVA